MFTAQGAQMPFRKIECKSNTFFAHIKIFLYFCPRKTKKEL